MQQLIKPHPIHSTRSWLTGFLFSLWFSLPIALFATPVYATQTDIAGPTGSGQFGQKVTVLPNGNFVVVDTGYDEGGGNDIGAIYLYNGANLSLISTLKGSTAGDLVSGDITVLNNGNYVVRSPDWDNGAVIDAGAVTWCSGTSGCSGTVSASNSLVGSTAVDRVGFDGITVLSNGHYVVGSFGWDNGLVTDAGAVSYGDGGLGTSGTISTSNSVLGTVSGGISNFAFAASNDQLIVGRAASNLVSIFSPAAAMDLYGNGFAIANGDSTPEPADQTDFGNVNVSGGVVTHTFTISNSGLGRLRLNGLPAVTLSDSSHFTVTQPTSTTIASRTAITFAVRFDPSAAGVHTTTLAIASNDNQATPYTFGIQGSGFQTNPKPAIAIAVARQGAMTVTVGSVVAYQLTISNIGTMDVMLDSIAGSAKAPAERAAAVMALVANGACSTPVPLPTAAVHQCTLAWVAAGNDGAVVAFEVQVNAKAVGDTQTASATALALVRIQPATQGGNYRSFLPLVGKGVSSE